MSTETELALNKYTELILGTLKDYVTAYDAYQKQRESVMEFKGELARAVRVVNKMSIRKFAAILKVSPSYLSKVERGEEALSPELARTLLQVHNK